MSGWRRGSNAYSDSRSARSFSSTSRGEARLEFARPSHEGAWSDAARMRTASSPALRAPPIETVATGIPAGICTMDSSESMPSRYFSGTGTPMTGKAVADATIPGKWAAPPAPAMITFRATARGRSRVGDHLVRRAVCRDDRDLVRDAELVERIGRGLHRRPVRVAAHDDADDRAHSGSPSMSDASDQPGRGAPGTAPGVVQIDAERGHMPDLAARAAPALPYRWIFTPGSAAIR